MRWELATEWVLERNATKDSDSEGFPSRGSSTRVSSGSSAMERIRDCLCTNGWGVGSNRLAFGSCPKFWPSSERVLGSKLCEIRRPIRFYVLVVGSSARGSKVKRVSDARWPGGSVSLVLDSLSRRFGCRE